MAIILIHFLILSILFSDAWFKPDRLHPKGKKSMLVYNKKYYRRKWVVHIIRNKAWKLAWVPIIETKKIVKYKFGII